MKQTMLIAGMLLSSTVHAQGPRKADVTIFVKSGGEVPCAVDQGARNAVTWMYARMGIRLEWRNGEFDAGARPAGRVALQIRYSRVGDGKASPAALAYALPFRDGAAELTIFYARVRAMAGEAGRERAVLSHVLAHEIGHILMVSDYHSQSGIMKASWDNRDLNDMQRKPLEFSATDVELIRKGLNALRTRTGHLAARSAQTLAQSR